MIPRGHSSKSWVKTSHYVEHVPVGHTNFSWGVEVIVSPQDYSCCSLLDLCDEVSVLFMKFLTDPRNIAMVSNRFWKLQATAAWLGIELVVPPISTFVMMSWNSNANNVQNSVDISESPPSYISAIMNSFTHSHYSFQIVSSHVLCNKGYLDRRKWLSYLLFLSHRGQAIKKLIILAPEILGCELFHYFTPEHIMQLIICCPQLTSLKLGDVEWTHLISPSDNDDINRYDSKNKPRNTSSVIKEDLTVVLKSYNDLCHEKNEEQVASDYSRSRELISVAHSLWRATDRLCVLSQQTSNNIMKKWLNPWDVNSDTFRNENEDTHSLSMDISELVLESLMELKCRASQLDQDFVRYGFPSGSPDSKLVHKEIATLSDHLSSAKHLAQLYYRLTSTIKGLHALPLSIAPLALIHSDWLTSLNAIKSMPCKFHKFTLYHKCLKIVNQLVEVEFPRCIQLQKLPPDTMFAMRFLVEEEEDTNQEISELKHHATDQHNYVNDDDGTCTSTRKNRNEYMNVGRSKSSCSSLLRMEKKPTVSSAKSPVMRPTEISVGALIESVLFDSDDSDDDEKADACILGSQSSVSVFPDCPSTSPSSTAPISTVRLPNQENQSSPLSPLSAETASRSTRGGLSKSGEGREFDPFQSEALRVAFAID